MAKRKRKATGWIVSAIVVVILAMVYAQFGMTFIAGSSDDVTGNSGCDFDYYFHSDLRETHAIWLEGYDFSNYDGTERSVKYFCDNINVEDDMHGGYINLFVQTEAADKQDEVLSAVENDVNRLSIGIAQDTANSSPDGESSIVRSFVSEYTTSMIYRAKNKLPRPVFPKNGRTIAVICLGDNGVTEILPADVARLERKGDEELLKTFSENKAVILVKMIVPKKGDETKRTEQFKTRAKKYSGWKAYSGERFAGKLDALKKDAVEAAKADDAEKSLTEGTVMNADMAAMMSAYAMTMTEAEAVETIDLPKASTELSMALAKEALTLCTGHTKSGQAEVMMNSGFEIIMQNGYEKSNEDTSHTCAYTVAKRLVDYYGQARTLIAVAIRGTNAGEWVSNFNFAEDNRNFAVYAENFLQAGENVYLNLIPVLADYPDALILVCGHSRGASVANMLGMILDDNRGPENVFVYTFATPTTYRGEDGITGYENIFNFINPADAVPHLPLEGWGYKHIGIDLVLPNEQESIDRIKSAMDEFVETAPTIRKYYVDYHSLTGPDEDGISKGSTAFTTYQIMLAMASSMTGVRFDENGGRNMADMYAIMDNAAAGESSPYAGLFKRLEKVIGRDGSWGMDIFGQHMPMAYTALIDAYGQILEQLPPMLTPKMLSGINLMELDEENITQMLMPQMPMAPEGLDIDPSIAPYYTGGMDLSGYDLSNMSAEELAGLGMAMPEVGAQPTE